MRPGKLIFVSNSRLLSSLAIGVFFFFFSLNKGLSQNLLLIDSIKSKLKEAAGEQKFDLLTDLSWEFRFANQDSTIKYANQAYDLGVQLNVSKNLAKPLNYIGLAYNYKGERLKAYDYYSRALDLAGRQKDSVQLAHGNNNIGRLFFEQGVLSKSYTFYIKALALFKKVNDLSGIAYTFQSLANLYRVQKDFDKAEHNYLEALTIRKKLNNKRDIMSALSLLGTHYQEVNKIDKSTHYFQLADSIGHLINDEINMADIKIRLAENYLRDGNLAKAEEFGSTGFEVISRIDSRRLLPTANLIMGKIAMARKDLPAAGRYFHDALNMAVETKEIAAQMNAYYQLAELAKLMGHKQLEIDHMNHYLVLSDSIKDLEVARQVERLQFQMEIDNKERENELLKIDQARKDAVISIQKIQNIGLLIIVGLLLIISFIVWNNSRKNKVISQKLTQQNEEIVRQREEIGRTNDRLSKRNHQLSEINHEKDTLMNIVAHDLKSPLNRIMGLIKIVDMEGGLSATQKEYFGLINQSAQSGIDLITDLLDVSALQESNGASHRTVFDLNELVAERVSSFNTAAEAKNIKLTVNCNFTAPFKSEANYFNRILDNLISNAIKFSSNNSEVTISGKFENKNAYLSIKDNGPGFSQQDIPFLFQKFKKLSARPTGGESSNGLGLAIVKTLVDRLGGTIELNSKPMEGSEFVLRIPNEQFS